MDELAFCEHWCGPLTEKQRAHVDYSVHVSMMFLGVGRARGSTVISPMVGRDGAGGPWVILDDGNCELAWPFGRRYYEVEPKMGIETGNAEGVDREAKWRLAGALMAADKRFSAKDVGVGPDAYAEILLRELARWGLTIKVVV